MALAWRAPVTKLLVTGPDGASLNRWAITTWSTKTVVREQSAGDLPDPARAVALRTSRRIDPAARLRRLFDRRKTGAPASPALALDVALFGVFHFRSRKPVRSIRPHPRSHPPLMDQQSARAIIISSIFVPGPDRFYCPLFLPKQSGPNGAEEPDWSRRRSDRRRRKQPPHH